MRGGRSSKPGHRRREFPPASAVATGPCSGPLSCDLPKGTCGQTDGLCVCRLGATHETPHVCLCGYGWMPTCDGRVFIYEWAGGPDFIRENEVLDDRAVMYAHRQPIAIRPAPEGQ